MSRIKQRRAALIPAVWLLALGLVLVSTGRSTPAASPPGEGGQTVSEVVPFVAYPMGSDIPVYRGEYHARKTGSMVEERQLYWSLSGELVFQMDSVFDVARMRPVSFTSRNFRDGETIVARMEGDTLRFEIRSRDGIILEQGRDPWSGSLYLWPNILHVVLHNWETIVAGNPVDLSLLVFHHNARVGFELRKVGDGILSGQSTTRLELKPSSWLARVFLVSPTFVFAHGSPARLLEYQGRSALTDDHGHPEDLRIVMGQPRTA